MKPTTVSVPPPDRPGFAKRAGEACVLALGVGLLASFPAALRTSAAGGSFGDGLLVSTGVLLPLVAAAILLTNAARRGFRNLVAGASPRPILLGIALWIGLSLAPIAKLGGLLKATTHHRGLGGATFGVIALAIAIVAALLTRRLLEAGDRLVARGVRPGLVAAIGAAIAVVPMLIAAAPLGMRGEGPGEGAVRATILDAAIVLVATALASSLELRPSLRRVAGLLGLPLALAVVLGAGARLELTRGVGRSLQAGGGLAATVVGAFEHWSDKEGDREGSLGEPASPRPRELSSSRARTMPRG
jgi:hypothetical protein